MVSESRFADELENQAFRHFHMFSIYTPTGGRPSLEICSRPRGGGTPGSRPALNDTSLVTVRGPLATPRLTTLIAARTLESDHARGRAAYLPRVALGFVS